MTTSCDPDQQFHDNLRSLGRQLRVPAAPSNTVRSRCLAALDPARPTSTWRKLKVMRKPAILSVTGLAAAIAAAIVLLFPWNGTPPVQAAMIMQKLNEQIEQDPLIEITLVSLHIDEVFVEGQLSLSNHAVAGSIKAEIQERPADETINVDVDIDMSFALSETGGWVLIRELSLPDPEIQPLVNLIFPPGGETLLLLPDAESKMDLGLDLGEELSELHSDELMRVIKGLIDSHAEFGATIEHQDDGTILLTLPIKDAEALAALGRLADPSPGRTTVEEDTVVVHEVTVTQHAQVDEDDELIGATLTVVYDPATEVVRSFGVHDFGSPGSKIMINIGQGQIDPALFDPESVTTPNTRVLDLRALEAMFENMQQSTDSAP
jgi:hypothetical protein